MILALVCRVANISFTVLCCVFHSPIVDSIEGVTHSLRTNEYRDRNQQFDWFCDALRIRKPIIRDYSRLNFVYTTLSKRKLTWFVDTKRVDSWDDPRMPTIQGIIRRGMTVEALREFILAQGFTQVANIMEWDKIWTINKRILDPKVPRLSAISTENIALLELSGADVPNFAAVTVDSHPKNKSVGTKVITRSNSIYLEQDDAKSVKENEEVTLMNWGNAIITKIHKDSAGIVTKLEGKLNLQGNVSTTDKKLTWVDASAQAKIDSIQVALVEYDTLITVAKVEEDMNFEQIVKQQSKYVTEAVGEQSMRSLNKGDYLQIPRRGYFIVDSVYRDAAHPLVLLLIPDGKMNAVSTLSSKVDKAQIFKK
jgi:glutamyl-tRNA synthetase